jgi:catechol 2,3-dioxygenase-like lactoylglutathione lyase family enzyme
LRTSPFSARIRRRFVRAARSGVTLRWPVLGAGTLGFAEMSVPPPVSGHPGRVLSSSRTIAFVPSTDLARSRAFYEGVLGLSVVGADSFAVVLQVGAVTVRVTNVGASLHVQPFTVLGWEVADVHAMIRSLVDRGVRFLHVDGIEQDEAGVWTAPDGTQVAWFRDPDGNTLSLDRH